MTGVIDAHHHFWDPAIADYPWMTGPFAALHRPFGPSQLSPLIAESGVTRTIVVQARQELDETRMLLDIAGGTDWIAGVVGWVDLSDPGVADTIAEVLEGPDGDRLVGIRHLVHDEPDPEWLLRTDVQRGLTAVRDAGVAFDLLVRTRELPAATELAHGFPDLRLVVDHLAKPPIADGAIDAWRTALGRIAEVPNVYCKVSGLVTEADWSSWTPADLAPYFETAFQLFGAERLMFGSDWPVSTLAASYADVFETTFTAMSALMGSDVDWLAARTANAAYALTE